MHDKHKIKEEIDVTETLKTLSESYEEISVIRMQGIRSVVLKTRDFLADLSLVFSDVRTSYKQRIQELLTKKGQAKKLSALSPFIKNGKKVTILLSSNTKLYGDIIPRVFHAFLEEINSGESDIVLVGKLGRDLFAQKNIKRHFTYFEIPDTHIKFEQLKPLVSYVLSYDSVKVFHGKFLNVLSQAPTSTNISGQEELLAENQSTTPTKKRLFIFEPSLETMLSFFETQIFTILFKQTVYESQLARYASRIRAMEDALGNINGRMGQLRSQSRRVKRLSQNRKQLEAFSGISLWGKNF